ncbi:MULTISPECIES: cation diffusion facilitator family transporter [unclassified Helicobacter]|uniref:cation diffusion facilitator family transporter n=1 Tax=unclassified Helicobacter TaxID=2593540 RepID=UPI001F3467D2|nr:MULTISPECIES: cation transporter [unclassified Helicobacter]
MQGTQNSQNLQATQNSQEALAKKEQRALKVSMISALILAVFGISFGVWAQSLAVMFDGFVALVSVGLGFLSVVTSRYIYKEDDDVFQYGYVRFEPMVNLFKSLILVFVCVYAFINAASSLVSGGYEVKLDSAVIYSICAFVFCAVLFAYTRIYATSLESDLIRVDNTEWKIDCVLYLGALAAFGVIYLLLRYDSDFAPFARYVDPLLLAVLSLMLAISPIRICIANFKDLIMVAPPEIDEKITQIMENLSLEYGFSDYDTHTAKSGRFYMIEVNILLPSNASYGAGAGAGGAESGAKSSGDLGVDSGGAKSGAESSKAESSAPNACQPSAPKIHSIQDVDNIRERIEKTLEIPSYKIWLSVSFTANPKWL